MASWNRGPSSSRNRLLPRIWLRKSGMYSIGEGRGLMLLRPRPDAPAFLAALTRWARFAVAMVALLLSASSPARAQDWLLINGILDGEAFETDAGSRLLARNAGRPS